jgi:hypothetical protein
VVWTHALFVPLIDTAYCSGAVTAFRASYTLPYSAIHAFWSASSEMFVFMMYPTAPALDSDTLPAEMSASGTS